jgi:hypothetical protein
MEQVPVEALKEGAWREIARIDLALEAGEIDERGWHEAIAELVRGRYLAATTPWGQSGKGGTVRSLAECVYRPSAAIWRGVARPPDQQTTRSCAHGRPTIRGRCRHHRDRR